MRAIFIILMLVYVWWNIFKFVPALLHAPVALLALGLGFVLTLIGSFILLRKGGK